MLTVGISLPGTCGEADEEAIRRGTGKRPIPLTLIVPRVCGIGAVSPPYYVGEYETAPSYLEVPADAQLRLIGGRARLGGVRHCAGIGLIFSIQDQPVVARVEVKYRR
ncbi:hypothetical protein XA68_17190 [Ophiocordyceps unilateralis]|uniref:Uncharacterized protein n=1 Tax=Ophiocordyceps unilateralis TaxID=268505 RepID=A0A2A9P556_OPHUN|nr:hypothetical protein XA68_17190 [Ophiocordyceps unilateralis]